MPIITHNRSVLITSVIFVLMLCAAMGHAQSPDLQTLNASVETHAAKAKTLFSSAKRYHDGNGTAQNFANAHRLYAKSADMGNSDAMINLGYMYFVGEGVRPNYRTAHAWYLKAAQAGNDDARETLATMYEQGLGTAKNPKQAQFWRRKVKPVMTPEPETNIEIAAHNTQAPMEKAAPHSNDEKNEPVSILKPIDATPQKTRSILAPEPVLASASVPAPAPALAPAPILPSPFFSAPPKTGLVIGLALGLIALLHLLWCLNQYIYIRSEKRDHVFAKAFFQENMEALRLIYLRRQGPNRALFHPNKNWAVTLCTQMVRFASSYDGADPGVRAKAKSVKKASTKNAYSARLSVFPLVALLQPRILANINVVDNFRQGGVTHSINLSRPRSHSRSHPRLHPRPWPQLRIVGDKTLLPNEPETISANDRTDKTSA